MGVILYIWQNKGEGGCIHFVVKNMEFNNQNFFLQTMISSFNPHRHFSYRFLIETLFDSCIGKYQSICSHMCMINLVTYKNNVCGTVCFTPTNYEQHQCLICRLLVHPVNGQHIFSLSPIHVFLLMVDRTSTDRGVSKLLPENLVSVCVFAKRLL